MHSNLLFVSSHSRIFKVHIKWKYDVPFLVVVLTGLIITLCMRWILHFWREKLFIERGLFHLGRLTQYTAMIFHRMKDKALANHTRTPTSGEGNSELAPPHLINGYPLGANTCCRKETLLTVIFLPFAYFSLFYCLPSPNKNPPLVFPVSQGTHLQHHL